MSPTLHALMEAGVEQERSGQWLGSLQHALCVVAHVPGDFETRLRIGDLLVPLGELATACEVYKVTAWGAMRWGQPMLALVACKLARSLTLVEPELRAAAAAVGEAAADPEGEALLKFLAQLYCAGSSGTAGGQGEGQVDLEAEVPGPAELYERWTLAELLPEVRRLALDTGRINQAPDHLPRLQLFGDLSLEAFCRLATGLKVRRLADAEHVVRQGEPGTSFFMLARGRLHVYDTDTSGHSRHLLTLVPPAIFGELAILTVAPRLASVIAEGPVDLLECTARELASAEADRSDIAAAVDSFARQRLALNLLNISPLFRPFDPDTRLELLGCFQSVDVEAGVEVVAQGVEGAGLYLIMRGEVEVARIEEDRRLHLATLRSGEVFGEISLLNDQPTSASVMVATAATFLLLPRQEFQRIMATQPAFAEYLRNLSTERLSDIRLAIENNADLAQPAGHLGLR